jgi:hypothetical protein
VVVVCSVVVGSVVVAAVVVVGAVTDVVVLLIGVSVVEGSGESPPVSNLTSPKTINATSTAPSAPNATSAAGLRYQGTGSIDGGPASP